MKIIKRNKQTELFNSDKIRNAIEKAFISVKGNEYSKSSKVSTDINQMVDDIVDKLKNKDTVAIEHIQDIVENILMDYEEYRNIAKEYILYRDKHAQNRSEIDDIFIINDDGEKELINHNYIHKYVLSKCRDLKYVDSKLITDKCIDDIYEDMKWVDIVKILILVTRTLIERDPDYSYIAARFLLDKIGRQHYNNYKDNFKNYLEYGVKIKQISPKLLEFDIDKISQAITPNNDNLFKYFGLKLLYDRYLLKKDDDRYELPQYMFMRVAMGLSLTEENKEDNAIRVYNAISKFDFMPATPTLFHSGTPHSQLASCYTNTVPDDLNDIFLSYRDDALLSKYSAGIGSDWSSVRSMGALIEGTHGKSSGVIPFLKIFNDTMLGVNQCTSPETIIYTFDGPKYIKDINIGDYVVGKNGNYNKVLNKFKFNNTQDSYEIKTKYSIFPLRITKNHPVYAIQDTQNRKNSTIKKLVKNKLKPDWTKVKNLKKDDYIGRAIPNKIIDIVDFNEDDARLYGLMLGDGSCSKISRKTPGKFGYKWGITLNDDSKTNSLNFVKKYLTDRNIHFYEGYKGDHCEYIQWSHHKKINGKIDPNIKENLPFTYDDLYNDGNTKRISSRLIHLPLNKSIKILHGLIESGGGSVIENRIMFTNASYELIEGMRFQCLRFGVPVGGHYYNISIPAFEELAELFNVKPIRCFYWFVWNNHIFVKIKNICQCETLKITYDLEVENEPSYMTSSALVHNSGKRKGSGCAYLETWHRDINEFLEAKKGTGDDRVRLHDLSTANWIPDLFMERVEKNEDWSLFSPDEVRSEMNIIEFENEHGYIVKIPSDSMIDILRNGEKKTIVAKNIQEGDDIIT